MGPTGAGAAALRANRDYLRLLLARLATGGSYDDEATLAKRHAESANSVAFSSLQRLSSDPKAHRHGLEQSATLANGNQRLTRALNVLTLHLAPGAPLTAPELSHFASLADDALATLALATEGAAPAPKKLESLLTSLERLTLPVPTADSTAPHARRDHWIFTQLTRAATELSAMLLAAQDAAPAQTADASTRK